MGCLTEMKVCPPYGVDAPCINLVTGNSTDEFIPLEEEIQRSYFGSYPSEALQLTRKDLEKLGKYLRKMLVVDPQQRAAAAELASDTSWTILDSGRDMCERAMTRAHRTVGRYL